MQAATSEACGLSSQEAEALLPAALCPASRPPAEWRLFVRQFLSPLVALLLAALAASLFLREYADATAIGVIVLLNALVGFVQEHRAERAIDALRSMTAPRAAVLREGKRRMVAASEIVPGDILLLSAGDIVPADAELIEVQGLELNEASLTGESMAVRKSLEASAPDAPLAERHDRVFMGSSVVYGRGRARVSATGMRSELGRIAAMIGEGRQDDTPLHRQLHRLSRMLMVVCIAIVLLMVGIGWLRGLSFSELLLSAISLAVAVVPEGLPAIVTIALALGVQRMAARQVLVRRLAAVETLGCTSLILTDKTGTLTEGRMRVRELWSKDEKRLLDAAVACCDSELDDPAGGDPTELAILERAREEGIERAAIEQERKRLATEAFDERKRQMAVWRDDRRLYVKGAYEVLAQNSDSDLSEFEEAHRKMSDLGLRVIAVGIATEREGRSLDLVGLIGLADPPREGVPEALAAAHSAGIRTVMLTGDHPATAAAIAREIGLLRKGAEVSEHVHARVTPEDKLTLVRQWKERGEVVAMTGDGVNDAPALHEAHVGIAMGRIGTEVARESADIVLADDRYQSIVAGIHEGRGIFFNIRKTLVYLLIGNAAELGVMLLAPILGFPLPFSPLQLLWINLVTDGLPALVLSIERAPDGLMQERPRPIHEALVGTREWTEIALIGGVEAGLTFVAFLWGLYHSDLPTARTMAFLTLTFSELLRALAARQPASLLERKSWRGVLPLLLLLFVSAALQILLVSIEATRHLFALELLPPKAWLFCSTLALLPLLVLECFKGARRRFWK